MIFLKYYVKINQIKKLRYKDIKLESVCKKQLQVTCKTLLVGL
jgi:hypothetical protein